MLESQTNRTPKRRYFDVMFCPLALGGLGDSRWTVYTHTGMRLLLHACSCAYTRDGVLLWVLVMVVSALRCMEHSPRLDLLLSYTAAISTMAV